MLHLWKKTRPLTRVVAGIVVAGVAATAVWWFGFRTTTDAAAATLPTTQTVQASLSTMEKSVSATGTLTPTVQEDVSFDVSGTVLTVDVAAGDTVTAGQQLATVDTLTLNADLLSAQATLAKAQASLDTAEDDDDGTDAADAQIAAAQAQVDVAQAQVDTAQEAMDDATLVAPVAGLLTTVGIEVGDTVTGSSSGSSGSSAGAASTGMTGTSTTSTSTSSTGQFTIVGTDTWEVDVTVDETDVALIAVGDQVEMTSDDLTDTVYGTVSEIGLVSSSTSGVAAYPVVITVTGDHEELFDGVSVDATIIYERRTDVLTVPSLAVTQNDSGESVVTTVDDAGTETEVVVETGETSGSTIEILSGLAEGDSVVVQTFTGRASGTEQSTDGADQGTGGFQMPEGGFQPPTDGSMPQMGGQSNG
ncbi:efflux RND transporter periplasmic adaptor subunit [Cellulomonas soli]|uniref:Hemolysin secretion protein D n=1 Tax=Cellulomonas soli TaxID=931535 RepID=A0A512PGF5_9CELL|nr:efflux RND transporter periplasmic adaptor subunit [Cellulomonas soli]NYI58107.1 macrolide-specific efflux system membrane fusion protein [Cellulomonas soli]GEP70242.1 hemolysin secretion protein D [Cellulomonas soli]